MKALIDDGFERTEKRKDLTLNLLKQEQYCTVSQENEGHVSHFFTLNLIKRGQQVFNH